MSEPAKPDRVRVRLSYANVMSTIAVFGVLAGGGAYAASKVGAGDIKKNAVGSKQIKKSAVKTVELADGAVTDSKLADSGDMATGAPTGPAGGDLTGTYPDPELGAGKVGPSELASNAVSAHLLGGSPKIADNAVAGTEVANLSLTGEDILDDSLTRAKLATVAKASVGTINDLPPASRCASNPSWGGLWVTIHPGGSILWYCGDDREGDHAWIPVANDG